MEEYLYEINKIGLEKFNEKLNQNIIDLVK